MGNDFKSRANGLKPRERIESLGSATSASAEELLAIILKTGAAGCDVMELSRRLIDAFGGIEELVRTDLNSLKAVVTDYNKRNPSRKISGLGRVKILELTAAFELARRGYGIKRNLNEPIVSVSVAAELFASVVRNDAEQECFLVLPLDGKKRPLAEPLIVALGTSNVVSIHPRDVFSVAVKWNASAVIVAHNHPSGNISPSRKDRELTNRLHEASNIIGIPLLDHIILGAGIFYSFAEHSEFS
jgi:DNA repair protein RadC